MVGTPVPLPRSTSAIPGNFDDSTAGFVPIKEKVKQDEK